MKNRFSNLAIAATLVVVMTSCFTLTYPVGKGAKTGVEVTKKNHYLFYGLAGISTSNPTEMAGGATDYEVTITHTFVDGLLNGITFGIYTPTTTIVRK
ncbi:MAG: hypothetical protein HQ472_00915 [Ignavibacteria bacterium]|nr:hypothetical protein [Ignavibacteria bacterium]